MLTENNLDDVNDPTTTLSESHRPNLIDTAEDDVREHLSAESHEDEALEMLAPAPALSPAPPQSSYPVFYADAALVYGTFLGCGVSHAFACGMTAQAEAEAAFKLVVGDHGEAFGFFQMHANRADAVLRATGIDVRVAGAADQARAAWHELTHTEVRALGALRQAKSPYEAGFVACRLYERAGAAGAAEKRGLMAERWSKFFGENTGVVAEHTAPASSSPLAISVGERADHGHVGVLNPGVFSVVA